MTCFQHPETSANLICERCARWHCAACVRKLKAGRGYLDVCAHPPCGGLVRVGAETVVPWETELRGLLRRPFTIEGVVTALALSVPILVASLPLLGVLGPLLQIVYWSAVSGYYFLLVDHIGRSREGLPGPSDTIEDWTGMLAMMFRGVACVILGGLPLIVWRLTLSGDVSPTLATHPFTILGLMVLGHTYVPALIVALVITNRGSALFWPPLWIQIAARAPLAYLHLVGYFLLSLVVWWLASIAGRFLLGGIPIVGAWLTESVSVLFLFAQATLVGGFLRRNASQFGYD